MSQAQPLDNTSFFDSKVYEEYHVEHITNENGLAQNSIDFVIRDNAGFIWIKDFNQLIRYDGKKFMHFKLDEYLSGIMNEDLRLYNFYYNQTSEEYHFYLFDPVSKFNYGFAKISHGEIIPYAKRRLTNDDLQITNTSSFDQLRKSVNEKLDENLNCRTLCQTLTGYYLIDTFGLAYYNSLSGKITIRNLREYDPVKIQTYKNSLLILNNKNELLEFCEGKLVATYSLELFNTSGSKSMAASLHQEEVH